MSNLVKNSWNGYNISELERFMIGSDSLFDRFFNTMSTTENYPPLNIKELDDTNTLIEVALAGFEKDDVKVYTQYGRIYIEGNKNNVNDKDIKYIYHGLANRSFTKTLLLSDDYVVDKVDFVNGLLTILVKRIIPEHHQRRDYL